MPGPGSLRPPPGPPPPYHPARVVSRVYKANLRPVVLVVTVFSFIWSVVTGVAFTKNAADNDNTHQMKVIYLVISIMLWLLTAIEVYGVVATIMSTLAPVRIYALLAPGAAVLVFVLEVIRLVAHVSFKKNLINECTDRQMQHHANDFDNQEQARSWCEDSWDRGLYYNIGWLIFTSICAFLFATLVAAFYHQILDPSSVRTQNSERSGIPFSQRFQPGSHNNNGAGYGRGYDPSYPYPHNPNFPSPAAPPAPPYAGNDGLPKYEPAGGKNTPYEKDKAAMVGVDVTSDQNLPSGGNTPSVRTASLIESRAGAGEEDAVLTRSPTSATSPTTPISATSVNRERGRVEGRV